MTFRERLLATLRAVDLAVPVDVHDEVKARLDRITRLAPSSDEPSVWVPRSEGSELIEVNFIGLDPRIVEPMDTYEKEDARLPLMVLSLLDAHSSMPDPRPQQPAIDALMRRLEAR